MPGDNIPRRRCLACKFRFTVNRRGICTKCLDDAPRQAKRELPKPVVDDGPPVYRDPRRDFRGGMQQE